MAYAVADLWQYYANTGADTRQSSVQRNYTGSNYNNSTTFDYFSDSASANETINFNSVMRYWGVRLEIGTAFSATSVQFIWEYQTASTTWATLRVKNHNAFLSTGTQNVEFTPPSNWWCQREKGYGIRCRIVSVSGITEGGANTTTRVLFNNKGIQATGTETTINGAITLNDGNTYEVLPATTSATGLIPIQMSVGLVRDISRVDVVLSGTTAGASDTVTLTGADLDGNTLTETIDVSAGNGTYTSTLAYADLTQVDCNGFTDGTTQVNQKKLGLIEKVTENTYVWSCHFYAGDGSTTTTVTFLDYAFIFLRGAHWHTRANATFTTGQVIGAGTPGEDYNRGLYILEGTYGAGSWGIGSDIRAYMSTGTTHIQGSYLQLIQDAYSYPIFRPYTGSVLNVKGSLLKVTSRGDRDIYTTGGTVSFNRSNIEALIQQTSSPLSFTDTLVHGINAEIGSTSFTANKVKTRGGNTIWFYLNSGIGTFLDCDGVTTSSFGIGWNGAGNGAEKLRISYSFNLTVFDEAGQPVENATVKVTNGVGAVISTTTDANGQITQQTLVAYSGSYTAYAPAITWIDKSAHTIEVKKTGYETERFVLTLTEKVDDVVVLKRKVIAIDQEVSL